MLSSSSSFSDIRLTFCCTARRCSLPLAPPRAASPSLSLSVCCCSYACSFAFVCVHSLWRTDSLEVYRDYAWVSIWIPTNAWRCRCRLSPQWVHVCMCVCVCAAFSRQCVSVCVGLAYGNRHLNQNRQWGCDSNAKLAVNSFQIESLSCRGIWA